MIISQHPVRTTNSYRPLWVNLAEVWRYLLIVALPLNEILAIPLGSIVVNPSDLLVPVLLAVLFLLVLDGPFSVKKYQVASGIILFALVAAMLVATLWLQGAEPLRPVKTAIGYLFVFTTYLMFSRVNGRQAKRYLGLLAWMGALVAIVSIAAGFSGFSSRLDSILWGRSNAFGAIMILPVAAGWISFMLYRNLSVLPAIGVGIAAITLTQSRGSMLVLLFVISGIYLVRSRKPLRALVAVVIIGVLMFGIVLTNQEWFRSVGVIDRLVTEYTNLSTYLKTRSDYDKRLVMSGRLYIWDSAIDQIRSSPWYGKEERSIYVPQWAGSTSTLVESQQLTFHSWALNVAATYGLIVLGLNLILLVIAFSPYIQARGTPQRMVLVVLLGMVIYGLAEPIFEGGLFNLNTISILFWMLAGIGIQLPES